MILLLIIYLVMRKFLNDKNVIQTYCLSQSWAIFIGIMINLNKKTIQGMI